jgi:GNAT superfamily N-acetyltransferase
VLSHPVIDQVVRRQVLPIARNWRLSQKEAARLAKVLDRPPTSKLKALSQRLNDPQRSPPQLVREAPSKRALRIEVANLRHRGLIEAFENQHNSRIQDLRRYALREGEETRTFLAIDDEEDGGSSFIAGYFSLAAIKIDRFPAVFLASFAVDSRNQRQGLGRYLLDEIVGMSLAAHSDSLGVRLLVTDASDSESEGFYEHFGLIRGVIEGNSRRMILGLRPLLEPGPPHSFFPIELLERSCGPESQR